MICRISYILYKIIKGLYFKVRFHIQPYRGVFRHNKPGHRAMNFNIIVIFLIYYDIKL